jgi:SagB-type dehydrogenase family enzyme
VYHYLPAEHSLALIRDGDIRPQLSQAAMGQESVQQAAAVFIIGAEYERTAKKYGERGTLLVHLEAGHAAQNIHLQAIGLGLASSPLGAFTVQEVRQLILVPESVVPLYMIPAGYAE